MHSYVTLGNDAPRGVRKRGLSKGKAGTEACVRGGVRRTEKLAEWDDFGAHFWPPLPGIGKPGSDIWTKFRSRL